MDMLNAWLKRARPDDSQTDFLDHQLFQEIKSIYLRAEPPTTTQNRWEHLRKLAAQTPQLEPSLYAEIPVRHKTMPLHRRLRTIYTRQRWLRYFSLLNYFYWIYLILFTSETFRSPIAEHYFRWQALYIDVTMTHLKSSLGLSPI